MERPVKMLLLLSLYLVQGLPYGFYSFALPLYLRTAGVSLTTIGSSSLLSIPWVFKALWSPLVDRHKGNRRAWIISTQIGMTICSAIAAFFPITMESGENMMYFLSTVFFLLNLCAATQDVAVDGLAIDMITKEELGPANALQVIGFKFGMFLSGLVIVRWGWMALFFLMALLTTGVIGAVVMVLDEATTTQHTREPLESIDRKRRDSSVPIGILSTKINQMEEESRTLTFYEVSRKVFDFLKLPVGQWLLLFVGTYKLGDTLTGTMLKTFFLDIGFPKAEVASWFGSFGLFTSIVGSFLGGYVAAKVSFHWALLSACILRLPTAWLIYWYSASSEYSFWHLYESAGGSWGIILVLSIDSLFNGMVTPIVFAYMMSKVDRRIGATHYTLLASVEVAGKLIAMALSGWMVDRFGYQRVFLLGAFASTAFLSLLYPIFGRSAKRKKNIY